MKLHHTDITLTPENLKPHRTNCPLVQITPNKVLANVFFNITVIQNIGHLICLLVYTEFLSLLWEKNTHLGCYKVGSIAGRHEEAIVCPELLGKTEITDAQRFWISRLINIQNITWLQVPVHNLREKKTQAILKSFKFSCIIHRQLQIYVPSLGAKSIYMCQLVTVPLIVQQLWKRRNNTFQVEC